MSGRKKGKGRGNAKQIGKGKQPSDSSEEENSLESEEGACIGADCPDWAKEMMNTLTGLQKTVNENLPAIQQTTAKIEADLAGVATRITGLEKRVSDVEDTVEPLRTSHAELVKRSEELAKTVDYLENYTRRNNLRIINIPETAEGKDIRGFTSNLLKNILLIPEQQPGPEIDRVHRLGPVRDNSRPRIIILRLLRFEDKLQILREAKKKKDLSYRSVRFHIFQDYSAEVTRRRAEYKDIKGALHQHGISFGLLFPARLIVTIEGQRHIFENPKQANTELRRLIANF